MAGSFSHCEGTKGAFIWRYVENMRDAFEACHMMHWMIHYMAASGEKNIKAAESEYYIHLRKYGYIPYRVEGNKRQQEE
jgi:hypothetical protein